MSKRTSTIRRCLNRASLYVKVALKGLREWTGRRAAPPFPALPAPEGIQAGTKGSQAGARFFFIVVEVPGENKDLLRIASVPASMAAAVHLPDGCRFRTCFEISAEYAEIVIRM